MIIYDIIMEKSGWSANNELRIERLGLKKGCTVSRVFEAFKFLDECGDATVRTLRELDAEHFAGKQKFLNFYQQREHSAEYHCTLDTFGSKKAGAEKKQDWWSLHEKLRATFGQQNNPCWLPWFATCDEDEETGELGCGICMEGNMKNGCVMLKGVKQSGDVLKCNHVYCFGCTKELSECPFCAEGQITEMQPIKDWSAHILGNANAAREEAAKRAKDGSAKLPPNWSRKRSEGLSDTTMGPLMAVPRQFHMKHGNFPPGTEYYLYSPPGGPQKCTLSNPAVLVEGLTFAEWDELLSS